LINSFTFARIGVTLVSGTINLVTRNFSEFTLVGDVVTRIQSTRIVIIAHNIGVVAIASSGVTHYVLAVHSGTVLGGKSVASTSGGIASFGGTSIAIVANNVALLLTTSCITSFNTFPDLTRKRSIVTIETSTIQTIRDLGVITSKSIAASIISARIVVVTLGSIAIEHATSILVTSVVTTFGISGADHRDILATSGSITRIDGTSIVIIAVGGIVHITAARSGNTNGALASIGGGARDVGVNTTSGRIARVSGTSIVIVTTDSRFGATTLGVTSIDVTLVSGVQTRTSDVGEHTTRRTAGIRGTEITIVTSDGNTRTTTSCSTRGSGTAVTDTRNGSVDTPIHSGRITSISGTQTVVVTILGLVLATVSVGSIDTSIDSARITIIARGAETLTVTSTETLASRTTRSGRGKSVTSAGNQCVDKGIQVLPRTGKEDIGRSGSNLGQFSGFGTIHTNSVHSGISTGSGIGSHSVQIGTTDSFVRVTFIVLTIRKNEHQLGNFAPTSAGVQESHGFTNTAANTGVSISHSERIDGVGKSGSIGGQFGGLNGGQSGKCHQTQIHFGGCNRETFGDVKSKVLQHRQFR
jgi:hypothetical protein